MEDAIDVQGTGSSWVGNFKQLLGAAVPIIGAIKGTKDPVTPKPATPATTDPGLKPMLLIGAIGVGIGLVLFLIFRSR
jgi:hypothetical protein